MRGENMDQSASAWDFVRIRRVESSREPRFLAIVARAVPEAGPADAGGAVPADDAPVRVLADNVVDEQILGDDNITFHPEHFAYVRDAARAVAQTRRLH